MYPNARRQDILDDLFGHQVADPYRWMEDATSAETRAWLEAQDALARPFLDGLAGRPWMRSRMAELLAAGQVTVPSVRGGRSFFARRLPSQQLPVFVVREADGRERTLLDPASWSDDFSVTLDGVRVSIEGDRIAYWISEGGDEESSVRIIDVATGELIEGPIGRTRYCDLAFLPGGEEYFYGRRLPADQVPPGEASFHRRVWRHKVGAPVEDDVLIFGEGRDKTEYHSVDVSRDGRWLAISASAGTAPRNDLYLVDLRGEGTPVPIQEGEDVRTLVEIDGDSLYMLTNRDAPRFRVVEASASSPQPAHWRELIPESDAVRANFALTDDAIVVASTRHAIGRVHVHDRTTGAVRAEIALPDVGSVAGMSSRPEGGDDVWFGYTDFVTPNEVHHVSVAAGQRDLWASVKGSLEVAGLATEQIVYRSKDGTDVTMFLIHRADLRRDGTTPTILYGYGGFNVSLEPAYTPTALAWAEMGGVYAIANLRGGSEEGEAWHRAGMREHKQNVFDDFIAAGEWLVDQRYTSRAHLGIYGGSNGGLLVGAALTQRPDLFATVVCSAPLLDMVRYEQFGYGTTWNDEYGTAADPTELGWLLGYSPYHRVKDGTAYPSVLFTVFDSDTRVDPMHVRKMAAALQHATAAPFDERPIIVRREGKVGHGARSVDRSVELNVDILAWCADRLGLDIT